MFREEITVIAIERWLVHDNSISWYQAYTLSLKKVITRLTKKWACDFIIFNLDEFIRPDYSYFEKALDTLGLNSGSCPPNISSLAGTPEYPSVDDLILSLSSGNFSGDCSEHLEVVSKNGYSSGVFSLGAQIYRADYLELSTGSCGAGSSLTVREVVPVKKKITIYR